MTSNIVRRCLWGLWFQFRASLRNPNREQTKNRYVSLKTRRPPAVVDNKIIKQKKLIMGFWMCWVFSLFIRRAMLSVSVYGNFGRFWLSDHHRVRNVAANSAPALMSCRSIFYWSLTILLRRERWDVSMDHERVLGFVAWYWFWVENSMDFEIHGRLWEW